MAKQRSNKSAKARRETQRAQQQQQRRRNYALAAVALVVLVAVFAIIRQTNLPTLEDIVVPSYAAVPPNADGKAWGPVDAPVVIQEFSDFQ